MVKTELRPNVVRILSSFLFLWFLLFPNYSLFGQTACNPPENVSISNEGETLIVEWEAVETAGYYKIIIDDGMGIVVAFENVDLPFFMTNLPYGEYFINIQSVCGEMFSDLYQVSYMLDLSDCSIPENVSISNEEQTLIVEWSPVETINYYEINIIDATGIVVVETTTDVPIFSTNLPNGSYLINIQTICGEGLFSDVYVTEYVLDEPICATPENVSIFNEGETLIVTWEAIDASFYQVIILDEMGELVESGFTSEPFFSAELPNVVYTVYLYQICDSDEGLELSDPYQEVYFMSSMECASPENIEATSIGGVVTVTWLPVEGVDNYLVTIINEEGSVVLSELTDATIYEATLADGEYTIYVQSACLEGGFSGFASITVTVINAQTVLIDGDDNRIGIPIDTSNWDEDCFMYAYSLALKIGNRGTISVPIVPNVSSFIPLSNFQHRVVTGIGTLVIKKPRFVRSTSEFIMEIDMRSLTGINTQTYNCGTVNWFCVDMELSCAGTAIYQKDIAIVEADTVCVNMADTIVLKCSVPIAVSNIIITWSPVKPIGGVVISGVAVQPVNGSGGKIVGNGKTTAAPNLYQDLAIYIAPNPTTNGFHLNLNCQQAEEQESGKMTFTLYTLNGQLLLEETYDHTCALNTYINIADLPNGMYLVQVQTKEGVKFTERVVKF